MSDQTQRDWEMENKDKAIRDSTSCNKVKGTNQFSSTCGGTSIGICEWWIIRIRYMGVVINLLTAEIKIYL